MSEVETPLLNTLPADPIPLGSPAGTQGLSVGHDWVTLLHPLTPGTHEIHIVSTNNDGTVSDIRTMIVVKPGR